MVVALEDVWKALKEICKMPDTKLPDIENDLSFQQHERHGTVFATEKELAVLDNKMADYIFYPISHVLRQMESLPVRARELALECLLLLMRTAWHRDISPDLGMQLMIFLSIMGDANGQSSMGLQTSEELLNLSYRCLYFLFDSMGKGKEGQSALTSVTNMPHVGKTVSVLLDGAREGPSNLIQLHAVFSLYAFTRAFKDREALATGFFPGITSGLTKVLTPTTQSPRNYKVLRASLQLLAVVIPTVFDDSINSDDGSNHGAKLSMEWLRGSASQVKVALANIVKLRQHDREEVRTALATLCLTILNRCRKNLDDSIPMLLETTVTLASRDEAIERQLKLYLTTVSTPGDSNLGDILKSSLYSWLESMPRVMLKADESPKQTLIQQITLSLRLLQEQEVDLGTIDPILTSNLRDSIIGAIRLSENSKLAPLPPTEASSADLVSLNQTALTDFEPVLSLRKSQEGTVAAISQFIYQLCGSPVALVVAKEVITSIPNLTGDIQLASFWLCLNIIRNSLVSSPTLSIYDIIDLGSQATDDNPQNLLNQLYAFSLEMTTNSATSLDPQQDYRLQALALEAVALQAQQQKSEFRNELIDLLYPILHLIGSRNAILRRHAMTTFNILSSSLGYTSVVELVVDNVDYLVNAVGLRLNAFDVAPQAPRVLVMMTRLAGPQLVPYLDDVVESIFVVLENFHGYEMLVEDLFEALRVVVEVGVQAEALTIMDLHQKGNQKITAVKSSKVDDVAEMLRGIKRKRVKALEEEIEDMKMMAPQKPWKDLHQEKNTTAVEEKEHDFEVTETGTGSDQIAKPDPRDNGETSKPPAPKTYGILQQISKLTQHYLPTSSASLRTSLLSLLATVIPSLSKHENSFLPFINELWPVLVARLEDNEAYVIAGACEVIGLICKEAGNFMRSRIEDVWPMLMRVWRTRTGTAAKGGKFDSTSVKAIAKAGDVEGLTSQVAALMTVAQKVGEGDSHCYVPAPVRIIFDALITLLCRIVSYVDISDEIFDSALEMLLPAVEQRGDVREVLEMRNPDAVWLALLRLENNRMAKENSGRSMHMEKPVHKESWVFADIV